MAVGDVYYTTAQYLMANGYTQAAAAGIAGDISGESGGDPEQIGDNGNAEGLIQWNPYTKASPNYPIVTGNVQKDFNAQLPDILTYNAQQGSGNVRQLNAETDPVEAAKFYSLNFERPQQQYSDVDPNVATQVYNELGGVATGVNPNLTAVTTTPNTSLSSFLGLPNLSDLLERLGFILLGAVLIVVGIYMLAGKQILQMTPAGEMLSHSGRVARQGRATAAEGRQTASERRDISDQRYAASEARRQNRESRQKNTGDQEERRLSLRERRVALAEATEKRKADREAANP